MMSMVDILIVSLNLFFFVSFLTFSFYFFVDIDIVPPSEGVPSPDAASENSAEFKFNRLGLRVPTSKCFSNRCIYIPPFF